MFGQCKLHCVVRGKGVHVKAEKATADAEEVKAELEEVKADAEEAKTGMKRAKEDAAQSKEAIRAHRKETDLKARQAQERHDADIKRIYALLKKAGLEPDNT